MKLGFLKPPRPLPSRRDLRIALRHFYLYIFEQQRNPVQSQFYSLDSRTSTNSSKPMLL